jgi:hypothetical protein
MISNLIRGFRPYTFAKLYNGPIYRLIVFTAYGQLVQHKRDLRAHDVHTSPCSSSIFHTE